MTASDVTLQINLSAGDLGYAHATVPRLISQHRADCREVLLIVDGCRPQRTQVIDPDIRFPKTVFEKRRDQIFEIAREWKAKGLVDRIEFLTPDRRRDFALWQRRWVGSSLLNPNHTHDCGATSLIGYLAGFELVNTRYVAHFDADILVSQKEGYSWIMRGLEELAQVRNAYVVIPRNSPPMELVCANDADVPVLNEGRPLRDDGTVWSDDWFSTRVMLMDLKRLNAVLPLARGRLLIELFARKVTGRTWPMAPEIMIFRRLSQVCGRRLILKDRNAWFIHPVEKGAEFQLILPNVLKSLQSGVYPANQAGVEDMMLNEWIDFLGSCD